MVVWRISEFADLKGLGGLKFAARWHSRGNVIVYTADSPASALLEILVNTPTTDIPDSFQLLCIDIGDLEFEEPKLPIFWAEDKLATREIGDEWLSQSRSAVLKVPSAIMPDCWNLLVNPTHPDSLHAKILSKRRFKLDPRLR